MVAGLSRKRKSQSAFAEAWTTVIERCVRPPASSLAAIDRDAQSYESVMAAIKLPKESAEEQSRRDAAMEERAPARCRSPEWKLPIPPRLLEKLVQGAMPRRLCCLLARGRLMAAAATRGALENVAINLASIRDSSTFLRNEVPRGRVEATVGANPR